MGSIAWPAAELGATTQLPRRVMPATEKLRIRIVPHFMRLHEWIALEEGLYEQEGLEPEILSDVMEQVSMHRESGYYERPQDRPFLESLEVANSACEWGSVCNAGAGMGRFVPDLYGVARHAIFAAPGSGYERLADLGGVPVGVGIMAGSHFTALRALETVLPREQVRVINIGGPGRRLEALLSGECQVANLLDPEIPIALARGWRAIATGEFRTLFWVSPSLRPEVLGPYFRVLKSADQALRADPERYMPLWERNVPSSLAADHDYSRFGRGGLLVFESYPEDVFAETMAFARRWGLDGEVKQESYAQTALPVMA